MDKKVSDEEHQENQTRSSELQSGQGEAEAVEVTLTDRLNSHLLKSFLDRLNNPSSSFPAIERIDCSEQIDQDSDFKEDLPEK